MQKSNLIMQNDNSKYKVSVQNNRREATPQF